ncbi:MAG: hypothetical protein ACOX4G_07255 [Limnochordia bacterium]|jgi:ribosomal protein L37AE/L43A
MRCPFCQARGGERVGEDPPFEQWLCGQCHEQYLVFSGYPVHPEALIALAAGRVRCPICGDTNTARIPDAPPMGSARALQCAHCEAIFPALALREGDGSDQTPDLVPIHPQSMIETVTGVERLPTFFAVTERLSEYLERAGLSVIHTDDKVDLNTMVREYTFFCVPSEWITQDGTQAQAVQCSLSFAWHAGQAQFAGIVVEEVTAPIPLALSLGVVVNPTKVPESLPAYLRLVQGLSDVLEEADLAETSAVDARLVVTPLTQEATIGHLSCVRDCTLDLRLPEQWAGLIFEIMKQKELTARVWELIDADANKGQS